MYGWLGRAAIRFYSSFASSCLPDVISGLWVWFLQGVSLDSMITHFGTTTHFGVETFTISFEIWLSWEGWETSYYYICLAYWWEGKKVVAGYQRSEETESSTDGGCEEESHQVATSRYYISYFWQHLGESCACGP